VLANHKGEIPFLVLLLPFLLGIAVGLNFSSAGFLVWVTAPLLLFTIAFVILNLTYTHLALYKARWIGGSLMNIILFLVGWFSVIRYSELNGNTHFSKIPAQRLIIRINNEPVMKNGLLRFTAVTEQTVDNNKPANATGTLLIAIKDTLASQLRYGDILIIPATYTSVDPPFNPAEFNYKQYLAHQNIYHQAFLYPGQYKIMMRYTGNPVIDYSLNLRKRLVEKLKQGMKDTSAIAVASTLILGYKADLSNELLQAYSKTGTIHILSVSGGHVAIIYFFLNILFGFLERYKRGKLVKAILILALIWGYSLLTGFSPAVCRAAIMISLVVMGTTYSRYINTLNILAASAFFLLLYNPFFIVDVGFQLSYLAVAGMVVLQPLIYNWLTFKKRWADKLWAICSVSIAAQLITFPLSAFYFHQFPAYFLISNLFILIPAEVILCVGMVYLVLPQMGFVSVALAWVLERSILLMNKVLTVIEHAPFASISKIWLTTAEYILLYVAMICLFYFLFNKNKWLLNLGLLFILILSLSVSIKRTSISQEHGITFLNLRKHQGIVFKHGDKAIVLTDLSPTDKNYQYSVQPYLDSCKIADTAVYMLSKNIKSSFLMKYRGLIQFGTKKILIVDKTLQDRRLTRKLKVDYLYLTDNPHISLNKLNQSYVYASMVIDGSNSNQRIADLEQQAKALHVNYRILKRNNSMTVPSN
jgi:competence protein ComEC